MNNPLTPGDPLVGIPSNHAHVEEDNSHAVLGEDADDIVPMFNDEATRLPAAKCQCYIAIFEDALDQLAVLGTISPHGGVSGNSGESKAEAEVESRIERAVEEQRELEERYLSLLSEQAALKPLANKTQFRQAKIQANDISQKLSANSALLAKSLRSLPSVTRNHAKVHQERASLQALLSRVVRELKGPNRSFGALLANVADDRARRDTLTTTLAREAEGTRALKALTAELNEERVAHEEDVLAREQVAQQLKDTIAEIGQLNQSEQRYIRKEAKAHEAAVRSQLQRKEVELAGTVDRLKKTLALEAKAHAHVLAFLRREQTMLQTKIGEWMQRYEDDTEAKSRQIEEIKAQRSADLDKFEELAAAYEQLEKQVEVEREQRDAERQEVRQRLRLDRAARIIQLCWRRFATVPRVVKKEETKTKKGRGKSGSGGKKKAKKS